MTITLLDGRQVESDLVTFDPETYHFDYAGEDITSLIRRADKLNMVSGFDVDRENQRIFAERWAAEHGGQLPSEIGPTSTLGAFWQQITTDPLAAPLETLNKVVNQVFTAPGVVKLALLVGAGAVVWLIVRRK